MMKKILIVDDDPDTCELVTLVFKMQGYQAWSVQNGVEALKFLDSGQPDVVLLDLMMEGMDGWETYRQMKARSTVPVIFLTALSSAENATRSRDLGARDFIEKPFRPLDLIARTETVMEGVPGVVQPAWQASLEHFLEKPRVSLVIPAMNEAKNLPLLLPYLPHDWIDEVILVDGHSDDDTVQVARQLLPSIKVIYEPRPGKGAALRAGYDAAQGDIIVAIDADGSHDPREIPRFIRTLLEGADFARGSRFAPGGGTTDMPRYRKFGNSVFVWLVNALYDAHFTDITYGFHAFWRYCLDVFHYHDIDGFDFEPAIYIRSLKKQMRIVDVPSFEGERFLGVPKLQTIPDGWRILRRIFIELVVNSNKEEGDGPVFYRSGEKWARPEYLSPARQKAVGKTALLAISPGTAAARFARRPAERSLAQLRLLSSLCGVLVKSVTPYELLNRTLQETLEALNAASGSLLVLDERGEVVHSSTIYQGTIRPFPAARLVDLVESGLVRWVIDHRQPTVVLSTQDDPRWLPREWEGSPGEARSALSLPLFARGWLVGVLTVSRPGFQGFTVEDLRRLGRLDFPI
ncbi:MAG TPA: response regulator [Anaerolineales bacterium]